MARTVVGMFDTTAQAQAAHDQLLAAGFERPQLRLATSQTLQAQHLPAPAAAAEPEDLREGFVRFFTDLFAGNENRADDARAHAAVAHADSAVLTVAAATEDQASRARALLAGSGAADVYKQPVPPASASGPADDVVDLEGGLSQVRDDEELDANGLTTH
jgi:hypothetical protein